MEFVKKHIITILCIVAVLSLALPMVSTITESASVFLPSSEIETKITGFKMLERGILAYVLIIGPALLVAMNYIQQLGKYKGILAILVPVACVVVLVVLIVQSKNITVSASFGGAGSVQQKITVQIGAILAFAVYIATAVAGAVIYHNFTFNKDGIERLKNSAAEVLNSRREWDNTTNSQDHSISNSVKNMSGENKVSDHANSVKTNPKKPLSVNHTDEILELIEKLARMKDAGILTEEEFSKKKKQLLGEI